MLRLYAVLRLRLGVLRLYAASCLIRVASILRLHVLMPGILEDRMANGGFLVSAHDGILMPGILEDRVATMLEGYPASRPVGQWCLENSCEGHLMPGILEDLAVGLQSVSRATVLRLYAAPGAMV
jgi:hypothetical protein